ncbi:MAG: FecR domain-containing protein [Roseburia sp.]|nr:FecR domain-containing protein [Roseburia sp.]
MSIYNKIRKPALLGMVLVVIVAIFTACAQEEAYRQIKVYEIEGKATVTREGTGEVEPYVNMMLQNKDKAETATESYVQLQLDEDKYILMEPSTKIELEATGDSVDSKTKINLTQGAIVNKIEKALSEDSTYEITTPNSTMAVRGTTFRVEVTYDETGESYTTLTVCDGKVECRLIAPDGTISEEPVFVEAGQQVKIRGTSDISEYLGDKEVFEYEEFKEKVLWFIGYVEEVTEVETDTEDVSEETKEDEEPVTVEPETDPTEPESEAPLTDAGTTEGGSTDSGSADSGSTDSGSTDTGSGDSGSSDSGATTTTYTVTFVYNGTTFATQTVTSGGTATEPILKPASSGAWNFDFSTAITADTTIEWQ